MPVFQAKHAVVGDRPVGRTRHTGIDSNRVPLNVDKDVPALACFPARASTAVWRRVLPREQLLFPWGATNNPVIPNGSDSEETAANLESPVFAGSAFVVLLSWAFPKPAKHGHQP